MAYRTLGFIAVLILSSCLQKTTPTEAETTEPSPIADNATLIGSIEGNFDGDNSIDKAELYHLIERDTNHTTIDERYILIIDRDSSSIFETRNRLSHLTFEGDINGDGHDEMGVYIEKGNATWGEYTTMHFTDTWHSLTTTTLNLHLLHEMGVQPNFDEIISQDSLHQDCVIEIRPQIRNAEKVEMLFDTINLR
jgi:hypothetical protein